VLGSELRKARLKVGLTQEQLAAKARISREYVSALERDQYSPTVEMLLRLCTALDVPAWVLIRRIEGT
jgi:transcriptional regulator with XRE-family HTH domain